MSAESKLQHVVIIGGGFGGLNAAKALKNAPVKVTLVDRRNLHLFQPLLYQVATGGLSPGDIAAPIRAVLGKNENTRILMAEVTAIDKENKQVIMDIGKLDYDTLIVAPGSVHHYYGNEQWSRFAPGLKSIEDALDIRKRILTAFERAEWADSDEKRRELLTFIIVGAGPTGVELAGTVGEITRYTIKKDFKSFDPAIARILLVEGLDRVLPKFPPDLSEACEKMLNDLGVEVLTKTFITSITAQNVTLKKDDKEETIKTHCVLWSAGIKASPLGKMIAGDNTDILDKGGRIKVEKDMTVPGHKEIFVIGDMANYPYQTGEPLPGLAPVAMQEGTYAGKLISARLSNKSLRPFKYVDKGTMATIGRSRAVAILGKFHFKGVVAWLLWLFVHLMYLVGFQNRVLVFVQWAWNYFSWARSARVITNVYEHASTEQHENNN